MSKLNKLSQLSHDESKVRGAQSMNALLERRGWSSLAKLPSHSQFAQLLHAPELKSQGDFLQHLRSRTKPDLFAGLSEREATIAMLRRKWPYAEATIVEKANRIVAGQFDLLGLRNLNFGDPIDWQ